MSRLNQLERIKVTGHHHPKPNLGNDTPFTMGATHGELVTFKPIQPNFIFQWVNDMRWRRFVKNTISRDEHDKVNKKRWNGYEIELSMGYQSDFCQTPMPMSNLYEPGNPVYDDDMQSALHCDNTDNYNPFDMKNTPLETDFEREFLDSMLLSDTSRIVWRNYDLDKYPPELAMLTYKRKGNQTMRELRDIFRSICKRHDKVVDRFCLSDSYTFEDQRCILASWRDRK